MNNFRRSWKTFNVAYIFINDYFTAIQKLFKRPTYKYYMYRKKCRIFFNLQSKKINHD